MKLFEHTDYRELIIATARALDVPEPFVEKDHWITELLRTVQTTLPDRVIFKGGTSLSKGWDLIRRFSEDVDLFVDPDVAPRLGPNGVDRTLKTLRDAVRGVPGLELIAPPPALSRTRKGKERGDEFAYVTAFPEDDRLPATVRLEAGIQSGRQPIERRSISSLLADFVRGRPDVATALGPLPELEPFEMALLAFRRTFVEKLFTIHGKIERFKLDGTHPGRDVRHYADIFYLAREPEVLAMLASDEYRAIRLDYDANSRRFYGNSYRPPDDPELRFRTSDALFPHDALRAEIEPTYERECRTLFADPHPPFAEVLAALEALRDRL